MAQKRRQIIAGLDVGTSKVCCFIARIDERNRPHIIGVGHQISRGLRNGLVIDLDQAEQCILNAVNTAEKMAGETIKSVYVNFSGSPYYSELINAELTIAGHAVHDQDIRRLFEQTRQHPLAPHQELIHNLPVSYSLDNTYNIRDARGMYGEKLSVKIHMLTVPQTGLKNLASCIERCHLEIDGFVASPLASGLSCLVEDEKDLGSILIDMGGGTTTMAVFYDGQMIFADSLPVGGNHITNDIARGLSTSLAAAERIKTLYGSCLISSLDDRELIDVPQIGDYDREDDLQIPRSALFGIIRPRMEEILEMVKSHLTHSGYLKIAGRRLVITGGASQLPGLREMAGTILDKQIRLAKPVYMTGLADAVEGPSFSACAGLLSYALEGFEPKIKRGTSYLQGGLWQKALRWIGDHF